MSLNMNEEVGTLVEGSIRRPSSCIRITARTKAGSSRRPATGKVKDVFSWRYEVGEHQPAREEGRRDLRCAGRPQSMATDSLERARHPLKRKRRGCDNWGLRTVDEEEADKMAADLKMFLVPEITRLVSSTASPVAVALALRT